LVWSEALDALRSRGASYAVSQLERLKPLSSDNGTLKLGVADRFFRDWVDEHYRSLLEDALASTGAVSQVEFEIVELPAPIAAAPAPKVEEVRVQSRLNERFTFATYVVADSNQLPAAAAHAVAENPGRAYNPLFIYGGTGLGKTHLLHAVGNRVLGRNPAARIIYLSSEEFTNQFIESVRDGRMTEFRRKFREECDVLLIDDIQFLGKKQETQNEFFYTFNALHQTSKAVVLTSDTVPAEIPGLEDRLRSRFAMGLITDVQEPDFEMRVAILKKKADADQVELPDPVAHFIARHVQKNVRELEGALIKLSAVHSLTRQPITEELAAQVLKDVLPVKRALDVESIQREVARYYKVSVDELKGERRTKHVSQARQVAMYLCRTLTEASLPVIGEKFGGKHHTTVLTSVRNIEAEKESDDQLKRELHELHEKLGTT
jgi:chromosomal replication initiator protein